MYILRCLFFFSLRKHWHFSCWFLTFVDRDLILSNILDLLFLQWFSCTSAARLRWLLMGGSTEVCGCDARPPSTSTITAHKHTQWTHLCTPSAPDRCTLSGHNKNCIYFILALVSSHQEDKYCFFYSQFTDARVAQNAPMHEQCQIPEHRW